LTAAHRPSIQQATQQAVQQAVRAALDEGP